MGRIIDRTGSRYGRLTVIQASDPFVQPNGSVLAGWLCKCDCGNIVSLRSNALSSGNTRSCGCLREELAGNLRRTHGMRRTTEYRIWLGMRNRCNNPRAKHYDRYGGRGIKICPEWDSFSVFLADMGSRPSKGHSLDRIDNDKGYEPSNCRWATQKQQCRNTMRNRTILYLGREVCIAEAVELSGISRSALRKRIRRGWPEEQMFPPLKEDE